MAQIHATEVKRDAPAHVHCETVRIHAMAMTRAKAVAKRAVPARARFWMERIHATEAAKMAFRPGVKVVDRNAAAIHRVTAADHTAEVIPSVVADQLPDLLRGLALSAAYQPNHATDYFARFPAGSVLEQESDQQFGIHFHAADGQDEQPVHPGFGWAMWSSLLYSVSARFDLEPQLPVGCHEPERP